MLGSQYYNSIALIFYIILTIIIRKHVAGLEIDSLSSQFNKYSLVRPIVHHGRTKREITSTRLLDGVHHPAVTVTINIEGSEHVLDLRLNENLITDNHAIVYQRNGETVVHRPKLQELDICQYSGKIRGAKDSWVAVSTCDGVRGIIHDGTLMRYIQPAEGNKIDAYHFLYDHSDLNTDFQCGNTGHTNKSFGVELMERHLDKNIHRHKRETYDDKEVRGPFNVNKLSRFVELVLVADNGEFRANGESKDTVHRQLKDVANIINSIYNPLNIFIALVGVVVWNERDEIELDEDGDKTLTRFLRYRKKLNSILPNDNAHLLTHQGFTGNVIGKSLIGSICTFEYSGGVTTLRSSAVGVIANTVTHQMGHNFGMEHDKEECECPEEKCIMNHTYSGDSAVPTKWSSCSQIQLSQAFEHGKDYCLRNKPTRLFDGPTCGNGFVEPGEDCDCGLTGDAVCTACCHPNDCVLRSNATCATGECCDTFTCRPKPAGTVCRTADKECDLPEYCSGHSEYCPSDVYKMDATPCGGDKAFCASGECRSHEDQCRLLWGPTAENSDHNCYTILNTRGDKRGHCGYNRDDSSYLECSERDTLCGLMQCRLLNESLQFGMESAAILSKVYLERNGWYLQCTTAMVDLGSNDPDPSLVPDGAKCGHEKMCLNHRCISISEVTSEYARRETSVCPSNCSGHGVCNSKGHCHCEPGFAPPLCAPAHPGGSVDSGPPSL